MKTKIRSDPKGSDTIRHEFYVMKYRAAKYEDGLWTNPYFHCDGMADDWAMTYAVPLFGRDSSKRNLKFISVFHKLSTTFTTPLTTDIADHFMSYFNVFIDMCAHNDH